MFLQSWVSSDCIQGERCLRMRRFPRTKIRASMRPFLLYYVGVFLSPPPGFGGGVCACDPLPPPVWVVGPSPPLPAPPPPCEPPLPLLWCVSWSLGITLGICLLLFFLLICYHKISINLTIAYAAALILLIIAFVFSQVERFDFFFFFIVRCLCVT